VQHGTQEGVGAAGQALGDGVRAAVAGARQQQVEGHQAAALGQQLAGGVGLLDRFRPVGAQQQGRARGA
jgi:hypothetical protein